MNYFAHGRRFLDDPYFVAGTAVPDWLSVVDRKIRARSKAALAFVEHENPQIAAVARGIVQHHHDDDWFHQTPAFAELSLRFTVQIRDLLAPDQSMRPGFLGHIIVELLLDAALISERPEQLDRYYETLRGVDPEIVAQAVTLIAKPADLLAQFIPRFCSERFLYDYAEDAKLLWRLNMVMRRVGLPEIPAAFCSLLPQFRHEIAQKKHLLLANPN